MPPPIDTLLYDRFRHFLADEHLDLAGNVLVGISGGVDSVVLLDLVQRLGSTATCLHVNYGLRGDDSHEDESFVRSFCSNRSVELIVFDAAGEMAARTGSSIQARAREIRYREFVAEASRRDIGVVLLGHHADDQVETILLHLFRGSGLNGLAGMPTARPAGEAGVQIVRPMLFARRHDIEAYANARGLSWRHDSSNDDPGYRRVLVRKEVIPLVERHFGEAATDNILRMSALARGVVARAPGWPDSHADESDNVLSLDRLEGMPDTARTRLILDALARMLPGAPRSREIAERIDRLAGQQTGKRVQLGGGAVIREREVLRFMENDSRVHVADDFSTVLEPGRETPVPGGVLLAHRLAALPVALEAGAPYVAYLDADMLEWPLRVSRWQSGDRIGLIGSAGTKRVSDLLTDEKIRSSERAEVLVVRSGDKVAWVVGVRPSAEFSVTDDTEAVFAMIFLPTPARFSMLDSFA